MHRYYLQHFEILLKFVQSKHFNGILLQYFLNNEYLFIFENIPESKNCKVAMKYFSIFEVNVATVFNLQWKIGNISDMFLQYSVLCGKQYNIAERLRLIGIRLNAFLGKWRSTKWRFAK